MTNKYSLIASSLSLLSIAGIIYQNNRLSSMFLDSRGENRALFGIIEINKSIGR